MIYFNCGLYIMISVCRTAYSHMRGWLISNEFERTSKEGVVTLLEVLSKHLLAGIQNNH
jgi:hypothetical protein